MVGTARIGAWCSRATALAMPVADPPPMATRQSAPASAGRGHRPGGRLDRDVLLDVGEAGRPAAAEPLHQAVDGPLAGDGQHPPAPKPVDLLAQVLDRADAEHDPAGQRVVGEGGQRVQHQRGYQTGRSASTLTQTDLGSV